VWKKSRPLVKDIATALGVLVTVVIPLYAWINNILDNFSKGLFLGALLVAGVVWCFQLILNLWSVDMSQAEKTALQRLNEKEKIEKIVNVTNIELKEGKWHVSGYWVPKAVIVTIGPRKFGDINAGKTFKIVIDSLTGRVVGYSSEFVHSG
jgi:hypothetical protein